MPHCSSASRLSPSPSNEESENLLTAASRGRPLSPTASAVASSPTSYDSSYEHGSPSPSVLSLNASTRDLAFKQEYGRGINNYSEVYRLPADEEEIDRLVKQHFLFKDIMGNYPPPLYDVMADTGSGEIKTCLDLGCGSGSWIFDFARDFPESRVVGVDLVPLNHADLPPNCRSEVDDINLGLNHFYGAFNIVHAQLIALGIKNYQNLINDISQILRPRGLLILVEWDFCVYDVDKNRVGVDIDQPGPPWWAQWLVHARDAIRRRGATLDVTDNTIQWVHTNPFLEAIVSEEFWVPGSTWDDSDESHMRHGSILQADIATFIKAGRPLLLSSGMQESIVDELQSQAITEIRDNHFPHYIRIQRVYARRRSII